MTDNITKPPQALTLEELSQYFHLPINEAAEQLGICATVLKKICRSKGVQRWPHRKIKSLNNMIESLQTLIDANEGDIPKLNMDMTDLLEKRNYLLANPNTNYKSVVSKYAINAFNTKIQKAQNNQTSPKKPANNNTLPGPTKTIVKKTYIPKEDNIKKSPELEMPQISPLKIGDGVGIDYKNKFEIEKNVDMKTLNESDKENSEDSEDAARTLANIKFSVPEAVIDTNMDIFNNFKYSRVNINNNCTNNFPFASHLFRPLRMSG